MTALLALLGLCAQVSARARPPVLPAAAEMPMADMDADCMRAMAGATAAERVPGRMDMTLDCIAKHGCIVVALVVEGDPILWDAMPPSARSPSRSIPWREGRAPRPEIQPPIEG